MTVFRSILTAAAFAAALSTFAPAHADKAHIYTGAFSDVAVEGYDPVAYFSEGKPVKGSSEFSTEYMGAQFRFANADNLATFKADPAKYAPQYGGYCAWAVAEGKTAKGDADYWSIVDGKLYLNYNKKVQETWDKDRPGYISRAEDNWPNVLK